MVASVVVGAALVGFAAGVIALGPPTPDICARNEAQTSVFAEFDMPNGAAMWSHFPDFGKAPELQALPGPVHVVAFNGIHHGVPVTGGLFPSDQAPSSDRFRNVVCVVSSTGEESYYANISFQGFKP